MLAVAIIKHCKLLLTDLKIGSTSRKGSSILPVLCLDLNSHKGEYSAKWYSTIPMAWRRSVSGIGGWGEVKDSSCRASLHCILTHVLSLKVQHSATWIYTSNLSGAHPSTSIEQPGALHDITHPVSL